MTTSQRTAALLEAHHARLAAVLAGDTKALAEVVGEELVYISASGAMQTRAEVFAAFDDGSLRIERMVPANEHVRVIGDVGLIIYDADAAMIQGETRIEGLTRSTTVYVFRQGHWQMVSQHQSRLET